MALEKDVQPLLTETTDADRHGILTVLKLFTLYELRADEFWSTEIRRMFPRPEIQEMAALFGAMELSVHRRVYDKLNKLLFVSNDEFYNSYKQDDVMKDRMEFLDSYLTNSKADDLEKLAAFCFAEGAVLFSSFAFLMSFRANGNNKLPNIGLAIKFSARDEDLHCQASSWLFRTLRKEREDAGESTGGLDSVTYKIAEKVREHEHAIVRSIFSNGKIAGITSIQMEHFVDSRIDAVLSRLGLARQHNVKYNPIADWFDKIVGGYQYVDFFAGQGSSYSRGWNLHGFTWGEKRGG